jgi:hypothetical protein
MSLEDTRQLLAAYQSQVAGKLQPQSNEGLQNLELRESAINVADRFKWGFADDYGKMKILQENGYSKEQVVRLKNGEFGVRTPEGIKPVDPKGFQSGDLVSDISESLGKGITIGGASVAGAFSGANPLAVGLGAAGGETIRQGLGVGMGVRNPANEGSLFVQGSEGQVQLGGLGEIAGEGLLAGASQALANKILSGFARVGATKSAAGVDDTARSMTGEIKPTVLDAAQEWTKLPQGTSKRLLKEFIDPAGSMFDDPIPHPMAAMEYIKRAGNKAVSVAEEGQSIINNIYAERMAQAGIDPDTAVINISGAKKQLSKTIQTMLKEDVAKQNGQTIRTLQNILKGVGNKNEIPLSQLQNITRALNDVRSGAYTQIGRPDRFTKMASRPLAAFTAAKNTNPVLASLNKEYSQQIRAVNKLQGLLNIRLEEGLAKEGRFTPEMFIQRLGNELKDRNLDAILKADDVLAKTPGFSQLSIKKDLLSALMANKAYQKQPFTGGRLSISGIKDSITKSVLPPNVRVEILRGMIKSKILNPAALNQPVSKILPTLSALEKSLNIDELAKKATTKVITGQSLNQLLYRR